MGLDMFLYADKNGSEEEVGYWRKHPNLHGFIVNNFAGGVDECQRIDLSLDDMTDIVEAVKNDDLPITTGFFFGYSDPDRDIETLEIFRKAIELANKNPDYKFYYQASW